MCMACLAAEDDADAAAIRETLAAYRFAGEQGVPIYDENSCSSTLASALCDQDTRVKVLSHLSAAAVGFASLLFMLQAWAPGP
jgi:hypothetical protein